MLEKEVGQEYSRKEKSRRMMMTTIPTYAEKGVLQKKICKTERGKLGKGGGNSRKEKLKKGGGHFGRKKELGG